MPILKPAIEAQWPVFFVAAFQAILSRQLFKLGSSRMIEPFQFDNMLF